MAHKSVLLTELIEGLALKEGDVVVDATVNGGGHAEAVGKSIGAGGVIIGIDLDTDALERAKKRLEGISSRVILVQGNFRDMKDILLKNNSTEVNAVIFDFGLSSDQLDNSGRGFSFQRDEPLLMTFEKGSTQTAADIVNTAPESELADIIYRYGEERGSRRIARAIVEARRDERILTSGRLAAVVAVAVRHRGKIHPATKTFQALRIATNDELSSIEEGLEAAKGALRVHGRIGAISFHSLEDRVVKRAFRAWEQAGSGKVMNKKPIIAGLEEAKENPRARSARLRFFEKQA